MGVLLLACAACAAPPLDVASVETQIAGRVTDVASSAPLAGASITTTPSTSAVGAASDGTFRISNVPAGQYQVQASRDGYEATTTLVTVREGETALAELRLRPLVPELAVTPGTVDLGATLSRATVLVQNRTGVGVVAWRASAEQSWLTVTPAAGSAGALPAELSVAVDRAAVPNGTSVGRVVVTSDAGTRTVDVRVERDDPAAPRLTVSTRALAFGDSARTLPLDIANGGGGELTWRVTSSEPWLSVSALSGVGAARLQGTVDRGALAVGSHAATLTVLSNGGTAVVDVTLTVGASAPTTGRWAVVATFPGMRPTSVSAPGSSEVWIGGAIRATDGAVLRRWDGARWTDESSSLGTATDFSAVTDLDMRGAGAGLVVGTNTNSRLVVARRVGSRFTIESLPGSAQWPYAGLPVVAAAEPTVERAWAAGYTGLLHRLEGGRWSPIVLGSEPVVAMRFATPSDGWALTASRLHHFDGMGWSTAAGPATNRMKSLALGVAGVVAVAGETGTFVRTGGGTWAELRDAQGRAVPSRAICLTGTDEGWVLANAGLMRLTRGSLVPVELPAPSTLIAVTGDGSGGAWAIGSTGDYANGYTTIVYRYR